MAKLPMAAVQPTVDAIYRHHEDRQEDGFRAHLGASLIGRECERQLWYTFRWARRAQHTGRLLRLFERGQLEEARLVSALRAVGVTVYEVDDETGSQFSVRAARGHFGGSMDGVALGLLEAPKTWHLLEFKTHNAKSFDKLKKEGVRKAKPEHFAQMQTYMHLAGLTRAFYMAVNKNDDEIHSERLEYDATFGIKIVAKAERIIEAYEPPERLSRDPSFWLCRFCDFHAICHEAAPPERTCRGCIHADVMDEGEWSCRRSGRILDLTDQRLGCEHHRYLPGLVPGAQTDAAPQGEWVGYRIGRESWIDEGPGAPLWRQP